MTQIELLQLAIKDGFSCLSFEVDEIKLTNGTMHLPITFAVVGTLDDPRFVLLKDNKVLATIKDKHEAIDWLGLAIREKKFLVHLQYNPSSLSNTVSLLHVPTSLDYTTNLDERDLKLLTQCKRILEGSLA